MVLRHNQEERALGTKNRIPGGVAIIISPTEVVGWRAAGLNPPITTPMDSPLVGRFISFKLSFPRINQYEKKV